MKMTGRPFTGRILSGNATRRDRPYTIGIWFERFVDGFCGRATLGPDWQGWSWMKIA